MFTCRGLRLVVQARFLATEADAALNAAKNDTTHDEMNSLLNKLSAITSEPIQNPNTVIGKTKRSGNHKRNDNREQRENRRNNARSDRSTSFSPQRRSNDNRYAKKTQSISHFDKIRNKKTNSQTEESSETSLNQAGVNFADLQEQKAQYIKRKLQDQKSLDIVTPGQLVYNFISSRALHKTQIYDPLSDKFAQLKTPENVFKVAKVSKAELELSKDKLAYNTKSRLLRALEQLTNKRGFKLSDVAKKNVQYLPNSAYIYPYANTTLPNNLQRPFANLKNLNDISKEEVEYTFATVVRGERPELSVDPNTDFPTERAKLNAHVVVNNLNRNAQLQVDNLHKSMASVMLGEAPIKSLPHPILASKKI
ncbi:hypothetical protein CANINC_004530 [Pichia inconspicua]|uniref:Uncharacterized protein n=1 Tax=Pichia inconspicua TaxID=52247 RepID=A0A4T0WW07_9ASCO|nr:hypothetical protein CANINC_004530 [[Candida] inconspicua]